MALELVYEGVVAGTKNAIASSITAGAITAGKICCLSAAGEVKFASLTPASDKPFGLVADDTEDVVASGKVSVYFTPGLYKTNQTSSTIAKGDLLTFHTDGSLKTVTGKAGYVVGICTEAAGSDGMIEMMLNISGLTA